MSEFKIYVRSEEPRWVRSIYSDVENQHAIEISTNLHHDVYGGKAVRAILLSREG
jgi:hypothetical protein